MPQKNTIKIYYADGFYHLYNRGVEKRDIFLDEEDFVVFRHLLKTALLPKEYIIEERSRVAMDITSLHPEQAVGGASLANPKKYALRPRKNFYENIELLCYCLMPNHYHLLVQQFNPRVITNFIRSISTTYVMYFNKKYQREGSLFQGIFRAIDVDNENYLLWLSRYIHRNPPDFINYQYSSYLDFLGKKDTLWFKKSRILDCFSGGPKTKEENYREFVEGDKKEPEIISNYSLE